MPIVIDDSSFPIHPTPMFSQLAVGDVFRLNGTYYIKRDAGFAYSFTAVGFVAIAEVECQPVTATLVITSPSSSHT